MNCPLNVFLLLYSQKNTHNNYRQKHSQTSLQILDDVSNRYYREMELQSKGNFKEKDPSILRHHDMIVQTSLCSTDDSSTTITEQQQTPTTGGAGGACDMGCQTR